MIWAMWPLARNINSNGSDLVSLILLQGEMIRAIAFSYCNPETPIQMYDFKQFDFTAGGDDKRNYPKLLQFYYRRR